jgi:hypothetical protein
LQTVGKNLKLYTVTVRRRPMYNVTFIANGGTAVVKQTVEEDSLAIEPTTTKTGYTFVEWDYDFTKPITKNTTVKASWTPNTDTPYKVEYYLENVDKNCYNLLVYHNRHKGTTNIAHTQILCLYFPKKVANICLDIATP